MKEISVIHHCQRNIPLSDFMVKKVVQQTLRLMKQKSYGDVGVVFATNSMIQKLNKDYRKKDKPTDILSFPGESKEILGDLFLSPVYINQSYKDFGHSKPVHYAMLLIHGTLHLLGYDHIKDKDFALMQKHESNCLKKIVKTLKLS